MRICPDCQGEGRVCLECDDPEDKCACDEPDIADCDRCDGAGEISEFGEDDDV